MQTKYVVQKKKTNDTHNHGIYYYVAITQTLLLYHLFGRTKCSATHKLTVKNIFDQCFGTIQNWLMITLYWQKFIGNMGSEIIRANGELFINANLLRYTNELFFVLLWISSDRDAWCNLSRSM